jgi:hypothetical protein
MVQYDEEMLRGALSRQEAAPYVRDESLVQYDEEMLRGALSRQEAP